LGSGAGSTKTGPPVPRYFGGSWDLVHLGNCTLRFDPESGQFNREAFSPKHRSRKRSPIHYDPGATCPEFEQKILGHVKEEDRLLMQKYAGQCLLGHSLTQRFMILDGVGNSSKSSFVLIVSGIIGRENVYELRPQFLEERFEIGRMVGRTLLVGSDVQEPVGFTKWSSVVARAFNPQVSGPSRQAPKVPLRGAIH
jgi:phage/plasmid-associated DNA primase